MRQTKAMRYPRVGDLTFRRKILLSLVGTVVLLVGTSLLAVRHQTQRQVEEQVELAMTRSGHAFAEVEVMRNEELERYGRRFSGSIRLPAALDAALDAGDRRSSRRRPNTRSRLPGSIGVWSIDHGRLGQEGVMKSRSCASRLFEDAFQSGEISTLPSHLAIDSLSGRHLSEVRGAL